MIAQRSPLLREATDMPYNNITKPYATEISFLGDVWGSSKP